MNDPSHTRPEADPYRDLLRAVRLCHPGWETVSRLSFAGPGVEKPPWQTWNETVFQTLLRPGLERAYAEARSGNIDGLIAEDRAGDQLLPEKVAVVSRRAGTRLMRTHAVPAGERVWRRYAAGVAAGTTPGHLWIALSVRAASFHLSPALLAAVWVFLEVQGGWPGAPGSTGLKMIEACLERNPLVSAIRTA